LKEVSFFSWLTFSVFLSPIFRFTTLDFVNNVTFSFIAVDAKCWSSRGLLMT
jgi:hypothetical protein